MTFRIAKPEEEETEVTSRIALPGEEKTEMTFRIAKPKDATNIAALSAAALAEAWKEADIKKAIEDENALVLLMEVPVDEPQKKDGDIAATIPVCYLLCYFAGGEAELLSIATAKDFRRRSLARQLLSEAFSILKGKGITRMVLEVREHNTAALGLYRTLGFTEAGRRKHFYDNPREDAVIMGVDF